VDEEIKKGASFQQEKETRQPPYWRTSKRKDAPESENKVVSLEEPAKDEAKPFLVTLENIEPLAREVFKAGRVGKAQQMAHGEDHLAEAEGVGRMNIAFDDLVVHQPVDDIGAFPLGCARR
jgi:hypothetical protein